jgi:hypothetical protein
MLFFAASSLTAGVRWLTIWRVMEAVLIRRRRGEEDRGPRRPTIAVVRTPPTLFLPEANAGTLLGVGGPLPSVGAAHLVNVVAIDVRRT